MRSLQGKKLVMLLASDFSHDSRVLKEALSARKAGMKVTILARKSFDTRFSEFKKGIKIIRFQTWIDWFWARVSPTKGREIAGSQSIGTPMPSVVVTYVSIINLWFLNRLFIKQTIKIKPDIIHANDSITLPAAYGLKKHGFKVVYDAHELYSESVSNPRTLWKKYYIWLESRLNQVDGIFSVCQFILDELDERYITHQIPKTILFNTPFYQRSRLKPVLKPVKLLYLGNFQPSLDFSNLFKAVEKLDNVTLTTIGPGWQSVKKNNIACLAPVKPESVIEAAANYDIGIVSYIGDCQNNVYSTPNKLFEYMMAGLAIAGSDLSGIRKIVRTCNNGVLFNPRNANDIYLKIKSVVQNQEKLTLYKKNSLKSAKLYCWENQEIKQLEMYDKIIKKN